MSYPLECQSTFCHPCSVFFWPYILIMGTLLEEFLFFIWENFLFDADCAILVNDCCSFLKGWYGREASKVSWVSYHLRLLFTPWSCLQPQQGSHSAIYDHWWGSTAFQMWGQIPTSWCSSPIMTVWYVFIFSLSLAYSDPTALEDQRFCCAGNQAGSVTLGSILMGLSGILI